MSYRMIFFFEHQFFMYVIVVHCTHPVKSVIFLQPLPVLRKVYNLPGSHAVLGREAIHPFIAPQGANVKLLLSDRLTASDQEFKNISGISYQPPNFMKTTDFQPLEFIKAIHFPKIGNFTDFSPPRGP